MITASGLRALGCESKISGKVLLGWEWFWNGYYYWLWVSSAGGWIVEPGIL
jgi:hypothetical protein